MLKWNEKGAEYPYYLNVAEADGWKFFEAILHSQMLCLWYLDAYVGVQCKVYKLSTGKTLSGVPVMHPCLSTPLPSESLAFPKCYVVPTSPPVWIICLSHWTQGHVSVCPLDWFPKLFQDPLIGRAEHLHYCSRHVNLCLAHPDGAILKQIYIWLDYILQWCKNFLFNNIENFVSILGKWF